MGDMPDVLFSKKSGAFEDIPARMRTMQDEVPKGEKEHKNISHGLKNLKASGSAQFTVENLHNMLKDLKKYVPTKDIIVVDLRRESHCFINGLPFAWYLSSNFNNINKTMQEIQDDEKERLRVLKEAVSSGGMTVLKLTKSGHTEKIDPNNKVEIHVKDAMLEDEVVRKAGLKYFRIPITDRLAPYKKVIDRFVRFHLAHKDKWLHFHCNAGRGRTTTFLALLDMLHNAKEVSFETILRRQYLLGGADLFSINDKPLWIAAATTQRLQILKEFHDYCKTNTDDYATTFSVWLKENKELSSQIPILENPYVDFTGIEIE